MRISLTQIFLSSLLIFFLFWVNPKYLTNLAKSIKKIKKRS